MANFIILRDADPARRAAFVSAVSPKLRMFPDHQTHVKHFKTYSVLWACHAAVPCSIDASVNRLSVIWGNPCDPDAGSPIDANALSEKLSRSGPNESFDFDGYYACCSVDESENLFVGSDRLGLFPIYYFAQKDILCLGSSPHLFKHHPSFDMKFNPQGLMGVLMMNCLVQGDTLLKGVKRTKAGYSLFFHPAKGVSERLSYRLNVPKVIESRRADYRETLHRFGDAIQNAVREQVLKNEKNVLLLSGGLDSKLVAATLCQLDIPVSSLTFGRSGDFEMMCAIPVAQALKFSHYVGRDETPEEYVQCALMSANWEQLSGGFNFPVHWHWGKTLEAHGTRFVTAMIMERYFGRYGYDMSRNWSFDDYFAQRLNRWGIAPPLLKKLLRPDVFKGLFEEAYQSMKPEFENLSDVGYWRVFSFDMAHRARHHNGALGWALCSAGWPIFPILSKNLIELVLATPIEFFLEKSLQHDLFCGLFPHLSSLPVDKNSFTIDAVGKKKSSLPGKLTSKIGTKWRELENRMGIERRFYYRLLDFNHSGWRAIRELADSHRSKVSEFFDLDVLASILPPASRRVNFPTDKITGSSGLKNLSGFILWASENL